MAAAAAAKNSAASIDLEDVAPTSAGSESRLPTDRRDVGKKTTKSETTFFDALKQAGIELRIKDIQLYPGGMKKADWDVGMAVDAVRMADFLDVVILVTGDGDFIPLVEYLKWGKGREVEVAAFSRSANAKLKEVADEFIALEDIPRVIMRKGSIRK